MINYIVVKEAYYLTGKSIYIIILLTAAWIVLNESVTLPVAAVGAVMAFLCVVLYYKSVIRGPKPDYSIIKLLAFPLFLLLQAYIAAVSAIKLVFFNVRPELIALKTELKSPFLRAVLTNSITLTPERRCNHHIMAAAKNRRAAHIMRTKRE
jgi:multicomponent Na+:H+ antiporter subunit E